MTVSTPQVSTPQVSAQEPLRVAIVEDDRTTREGLAALIDGTPGYRCVGRYESVEEALRIAESFGTTVFSAGGASIYAQSVPLADTMYLSYIKGQFTGDAYFPAFSEQEWAVDRREDHPRFEFVVYRRIRPPIAARGPTSSRDRAQNL